MVTANVHEVKANLSKYLDLLERGETVIICRRNKPVAEMRPLAGALPPRRLGMMEGLFDVPESFFEPLPEEFLEPFGTSDDEPAP